MKNAKVDSSCSTVGYWEIAVVESTDAEEPPNPPSRLAGSTLNASRQVRRVVVSPGNGHTTIRKATAIGR